jgi:hypothetical protein
MIRLRTPVVTLLLTLSLVAGCSGGDNPVKDAARKAQEPTATTTCAFTSFNSDSDPKSVIDALGDLVTREARGLSRAITQMKPAPATAGEALGRLRLTDPQVDEELASVDRALEKTCGGAQVSGLAAAAPRFNGQTLELGNYSATAGTCSATSVRAGRFVYFTCTPDSTPTYSSSSSSTKYLLDLDTGLVTDWQWSDDINSEKVFVTGDRAMYWRTTEVPAQGLEKPKATVELVSTTLDRKTTDVETTFTGSEQATAEILAVYRDRILSTESEGTSRGLVVRSADGRELMRRNQDSSVSTPRAVIDGVEAFSDFAVDLRTAKPVDVGNSWSRESKDDCADTVFVSTGYQSGRASGEVVRRTSDGALQIKPAGASKANTVAPLKEFLLVTHDDTGELELRNADDSVKWRVDDQVFSAWEVFGGALYVTNRSSEIVGVDTATGEEADVDSNVSAVLKIPRDSRSIDHAKGRVLALSDNVVSVYQVPACKTG